MVDANTWKIISIVGYSLAGLLFVATIVMFFKMNILAIIGNLTGKTAARQIQEIRERNRGTGNKRHQPDAFNLERGTLKKTGRSVKMGKTAQALAHASKRLDLKGKSQETSRPNALEALKAEGLQNQTLVWDSSEKEVEVAGPSPTEMQTESTKVLDDGTNMRAESTEVLNEDSTEVLIESTKLLNNGTEVLTEGTQILANDDGTEVLQDDGTTVLYPTAELEEEKATPAVEFKIVKDITVIHTNEVI